MTGIVYSSHQLEAKSVEIAYIGGHPVLSGYYIQLRRQLNIYYCTQGKEAKDDKEIALFSTHNSILK